MTALHQAKANTRFIDLDAAVEEREAIEVSFADKTYLLPGAVPAGVVLAYLRNAETGTIPNNEIEGLFVDLVGEDIMKEMIENGLSYKKLEFLVTWLLVEYGISANAEVVEETSDGDSPNG